MNRKTFLRTLLGLPAVLGLAKATHAEPRAFDYNPCGGNIRWTPRPYVVGEGCQGSFIPKELVPALDLATTTAKRCVVFGPRGCGKTAAAATLAVKNYCDGKRVLYAASSPWQIERFWKEARQAFQIFARVPINEEGTIVVKCVRNPEESRGINVDLVILDQFSEMDYGVWDVFAPMLADNNGQAILICEGHKLHRNGRSLIFPPSSWKIIRFETGNNPHAGEVREYLKAAAVMAPEFVGKKLQRIEFNDDDREFIVYVGRKT